MSRRRDSVRALDGTPPVVSLSDLHGYRTAAERALLALRDHADYDPVVIRGDDGNLHWAGNDYVLVFNGDLIDRGPDSAGCLELAVRLQDEAPAGRVRYHLGNHEGYLLFQQLVADTGWYCSSASAETRRSFLARTATEAVTMAYEGYTFTYSHAGSETGVEVTRLNDRLATAGAELLALATGEDGPRRQRAVLEAYPDLFGVGQPHRKGPGASPLWLSFDCLPADAPPQVVGHTRHGVPTRNGRVVCADVVLQNRGSSGGEAVLVETPGDLVALVRDGDGGVDRRSLAPDP